ncbi:MULTISPECIES: hypothetical protein [unclassified Sinorhizobium]|uniref:hypothetical protein n=1 Tax=unclassified Sinorhizobium TaxID=2613772 RepID=UPI0024C44DD7|nr:MULTISPECIES: hypothetical protein [unclassified Sinorhizobium]MDK1376781.1 hypothetical protein [Sinorhizobium sp. 6-70]MDK1479553.1 hypothetical protein [Sinorhizobium sp. 6-117]
MHDRDNYGHPERRASTGLPLGIMLLSMLAITAYLVVGGALLDDKNQDIVVYVPQASAPNPH